MARELKPHGTRAAYERHRRDGTPYCDACRVANARAAAARRASAAAGGIAPEQFAHGVSGYFNYACRCEVCSAAGSAKNKADRAAAKAKKAALQKEASPWPS